ncbi:hypothetical protein HJG60_007786 [Phyllostomus discolor]|uniref:Uncharacterized protein n=1 Tax=Phyllostomus discolor TaxID=89673 RepID=A0A834BJD9_9CHIR|nr:hypothetical protein HJG60_007786 [Phyllostomus discolor]
MGRNLLSKGGKGSSQARLGAYRADQDNPDGFVTCLGGADFPCSLGLQSRGQGTPPCSLFPSSPFSQDAVWGSALGEVKLRCRPFGRSEWARLLVTLRPGCESRLPRESVNQSPVLSAANLHPSVTLYQHSHIHTLSPPFKVLSGP